MYYYSILALSTSLAVSYKFKNEGFFFMLSMEFRILALGFS